MSNPTTIYGLCDPQTGELRYVGKTISPRSRLREHVSRPHGAHMANWIAQVGSPTMVILEVVHADWAEAEKFWIAFYRGHGCRLINVTNGGDNNGGGPLTPAHKISLSRALKGKPKPPRTAEHCARIAERARGRAQSPETRAAKSATLKGRVFTPEHREALSAAALKAGQRPELRQFRRDLAKRMAGDEDVNRRRSETMKRTVERKKKASAP